MTQADRDRLVAMKKAMKKLITQSEAAEELGLSIGRYSGFSMWASKETVRKWMIHGKLWRAKKENVKPVHTWRPRRSRLGELVQWDTIWAKVIRQ